MITSNADKGGAVVSRMSKALKRNWATIFRKKSIIEK